MKRVLILGNSYMTALKRVLLQRTIDGVQIDILAKANDVLLKSLSFYGNALHCSDDEIISLFPTLSFDENGYLSLEPYTDVIVYGCQLWTKGRGQNWLQFVSEIESGRYSSAAMVQTFKDDNMNTSHYKFVSRWKEDCKATARLIVFPSPLPNELSPNLSTEFNDFAANQATPIFNDLFSPLGAEFVDFSQKLMASNGYCVDKKYKAAREEDLIHLNDEGANHVLDTMLSTLLAQR